MDINNIYQIMNKIESDSSRTSKESILKDNKDNQDFIKALSFLLNPYIVTGISTKKMNKELDVAGKNLEIKSLEDLIEYLKTNNSGRDLDIMNIQKYISTLESDELKTFVKKFVTKDLKLGISEKTVNKIYGKNTIPTFAVMLAESFDKKSDKITGDFYVTLKLDGNRCIVINNHEEGVKFFSRKGQPIEGLDELANQFSKIPQGVYDGELLKADDSLKPDELFRATQKIVRKDGVKKGLNFYIFDYLTIEEFKEGQSKTKYENRRNILDTIISDFVEDKDNISVLPVLYKGNDKSAISLLAKSVEEKGYEGLMVNTAEGLYKSKRVVDLQKVKSMQTADLLVVSLEKAIDGQFEGLMSRVNVEYKGNIVGCGSGFTLEQRREFANNPDLICGKIIEVQFFEESKDEKTGLPSLRFPVFKCIREDKGADDINYG